MMHLKSNEGFFICHVTVPEGSYPNFYNLDKHKMDLSMVKFECSCWEMLCNLWGCPQKLNDKLPTMIIFAGTESPMNFSRFTCCQSLQMNPATGCREFFLKILS